MKKIFAQTAANKSFDAKNSEQGLASLITAAPTSAERTMQEIQEQKADICVPHYHEFYAVTTEHGFTKITLPKKK